VMKLNDISCDKDGNNPLLSFQKFEILPFGHELRRCSTEFFDFSLRIAMPRQPP